MSSAFVFLPVDLPRPADLAAAGAGELALILARARFTPGPAGSPAALESRLCAHFGLEAPPDALPVAALTAPLDGLDAASHPLRADPVCLRPDLVDVALLPGHPLGLDAAQAQALICEVNERLPGGELRLASGASPLRWYVESREPLAVTALPPRAVAGRGTREYLPRGGDRRRLLGWLTEVQFVLHGSAVNAARSASGLPPVNSLWLWGSGALADASPARPGTGAGARHAADPQRLFADCALARALALRAGLSPGSLQSVAALASGGWVAAGGTIRVVDDPGPGLALDFAAATQTWARPLLAALRRGHITRLLIDTPSGRHELGRLGLLRFWRRA